MRASFIRIYDRRPWLTRMRIPVVIPAYQPNDFLLRYCRQLFDAGIEDIVIVDDGSGEEYQILFDRIKEEYPFVVLAYEPHCGKGRALKTAFTYLAEERKKGEKILGCVTADADGQFCPADVLRMMEKLRSHPKALILGARKDGGNHFNNKPLRKFAYFLIGLNLEDIRTGLRAIPADFMEELIDTEGETYNLEMQMLVDCVKRRKILEIEVDNEPRTPEESPSNYKKIDAGKSLWVLGKTFAYYIGTSLAATIVDLILFAFLCPILEPILPFWYIAVATAAARCVSAMVNYTLNYIVVFHSKRNVTRSLAKFVAVTVVQLVMSAILVSVFVHMFHAASEVGTKIRVDVFLFFVSYVIQRKFVF